MINRRHHRCARGSGVKCLEATLSRLTHKWTLLRVSYYILRKCTHVGSRAHNFGALTVSATPVGNALVAHTRVDNMDEETQTAAYKHHPRNIKS